MKASAPQPSPSPLALISSPCLLLLFFLLRSLCLAIIIVLLPSLLMLPSSPRLLLGISRRGRLWPPQKLPPSPLLPAFSKQKPPLRYWPTEVETRGVKIFFCILWGSIFSVALLPYCSPGEKGILPHFENHAFLSRERYHL